MKPYLLFSTVSSKKEAQKIASVLIHQKLAACVNMIPNVHSFFRWQGAIDHAAELLLIIKTNERHLKQVEKAIRKYHSYQVPEIIGWPITWGHKPYLAWISDSVSFH
ncbi:MAG: divalent-cation tolerance protein CutA [Candidatus Omnitrophica bacterium]|nr:divalent-cation tolerance protein CutA [Candidatus Omnitrophota bacterium]